MKKKLNRMKQKQSAHFSNQIPQFIQLATYEVLKRNKYPPKDGSTLVALDMFLDRKRANAYSTGIFVQKNQTQEAAQQVTRKLLEETADLVNAVLDRNPKSMSDARTLLSELLNTR